MAVIAIPRSLRPLCGGKSLRGMLQREPGDELVDFPDKIRLLAVRKVFVVTIQFSTPQMFDPVLQHVTIKI